MTVNEVGMIATYALFTIAGFAAILLLARGLGSLVAEEGHTPEEFRNIIRG